MSTKINEAIEIISKMNVLEIVELTKEIEKKFNISQSDLINNNTNKLEKEEKVNKEEKKSEYTVIMTSYGNSKLNVIKTIRSILNLGLKEAKDFVENIPATIKEKIQEKDAEEIKNKLESSGAKIELK